MKSPHSIVVFLVWFFGVACLHAYPIAGVDFDDGAGGANTVPEDLNVVDTVTVSDWTFSGGGGILGQDANSNTDRPSPPVRKFNGPDNSSATPPAVGDVPPVNGVHSFSLTFGADAYRLTKVKFNFSSATPSTEKRWVAFRTSLDDNIVFSQNGVARPEFPSVTIYLLGAKYDNLANQTIELIWYCGGRGSGDIDIDSIIIDGFRTMDTDADELYDDWEQEIVNANSGDLILSILDVLPGDDFDNDLSTNLNEFAKGTNGADPDSDDDGLIDGVESNDGTFNDALTDTGTNPLKEDTDKDEFRDGAEVNIRHTDPNLTESVPTKLPVLFLGNTGTGDSAALRVLEDRFGMKSITRKAANAVTIGGEAGYGLVVTSSTADSGEVRNKFQDSLVPVVNWEEAVVDNSAVGEYGMCSAIMTKSTSVTEMTLNIHPITQRLPETLTLFNAAGPQTISTAALFAGLKSAGIASNGSAIGNDMLLLAEAGDAVDPAAGVANNTAPARRVMLPFTDSTITYLTPDGISLFGNALDWAAGFIGVDAGGDIKITQVTYDNVSEPGNVKVNLTFTSKLNQLYTVLTSTDLSTPIDSRAIVNATVTGADGSTIYTVDFNAAGLSVSDPARFFVVKHKN